MTSAKTTVRNGNAAALARARAEAAARKHQEVLTALAAASNRGESVTVSTLAATAGVSRQFIYSRHDLIESVRRHQDRHPDVGSVTLRGARVTDLVNARDTIKRLRSEIQSLNWKLDAGLAAQVELRDEKRVRQLYEQRGHEIDRLLTQNADLLRTVVQQRELVRTLEDELVIERTALRELTGQPANVTNVRFRD